MSIPQQLNIHSLFLQTTMMSICADGDRTYERRNDSNEDNESSRSIEQTNIPDLVLSNLTGSSDFAYDGTPIDDDDDCDDNNEEESVSSADDDDDSRHSRSYQPHYDDESRRLETTQTCIQSDCMIHTKHSSNIPKSNISSPPPLDNEDTFFPIDVPPREPVPDGTVQTCFDSVHLFSPTYFTGPEKHLVALKMSSSPSSSRKQDNRLKPSSLSVMIHPMSLASLATATPNRDQKRITPPCSSNRTTTTPRYRTPLSKTEMDRNALRTGSVERDATGSDRTTGLSRLPSAFKSSMARESIEYVLSTGKKGMTRQLCKQRRNLLPEDLSERMVQSKSDSSLTKESCGLFDKKNAAINALKMSPDLRTSLSILLLECHQKVFEIVVVDHVTAETSVGDVLSRARSQATDPRLSRQTYVSLCNSVNEMAAMMLPVYLMMNMNQEISSNRMGRKHGETTLTKYDRLEAASKTCDDPSLGRLLVAVPEGSTAEMVRGIQKALWCHPRIQRWWQKSEKKRDIIS